jgi:D-amino-acid dehydrogenase
MDAQLIRWLWRFYRSANHGHVRRSVPLLRDLSFASLELYDELDRIEGFDFDLVRNGYLQVGKEGFSKDDAEVRILNEAGVVANVLTREEAQELVPETELEIGGAIHFPQDWNLSPHRFVTGLAAQAAALGADIRTGTEVLGFERNGSRVSLVKTTRGDFSPGEIVLAAGSWSPVVARDLSLSLPIQGGKGYSITFKRPPQAPSVPISLAEARVGVSAMGDYLRFAGTLELSGLTLYLDPVRVSAILRAVPEYTPGLDPAKLEMVEIWRGMRPCTPDGLPLLGRPESLANLTVAAGHAMIGVSLAPVTGELVSEIVCGEEPGIDLALTRPERFG